MLGDAPQQSGSISLNGGVGKMETTNQKKEAKQASNEDTVPVAPYNLLYITRAYNRREITFEEWLRLTKEWAEQVIRQFGKVE